MRKTKTEFRKKVRKGFSGKIDFFDVVLFAGLALISIGMFLMYTPLAWIFWGVVLVIIAAAFELPNRKKSD